MRTLRSALRSALVGALSLGLLAIGAACAKPAPPPANASDPIGLDGAHDKLRGDDYLHYAIGDHIAAPPEIVWEIITDAAGYPEWNSTVISVDGEIALDEKIKLVAKIDPDRTFKLEVSAFEPASRMVWEDGNNMFKGTRTFTLVAHDGGTNFTMKEALTGTMMAKIEPQLPDFGLAFDAFMADLKVEAERRAPAPPSAPEATKDANRDESSPEATRDAER